MVEIWKPLANMPYYEVSNMGRLRSYLPRHKYGGRLVVPRLVKTERVDDGGYIRVDLYVYAADGTKKRKHLHLHRLVLETFDGPPPHPGMHGCHGDGNKLNCRHDNLRWDTPAGNTADRVKHGTLLSGVRHYKHILTTEQVAEIKAKTDWQKGDVIAMAARFGVKPGTISKVKTGANRRNG